MEQAPTGRLPVPRTRSLNSLSTATSDAEAKRSAIRGRSPSMRGTAPPPPPGAARTSASRLPSAASARSVSPSPRVSATTTRNPSVMSTTGARTITRTGAPPPPPVRSSMIRAPSPASRRSSMPDVGEEGALDGRSSGDVLDEPKRPSHTRASSTASDASTGLPKSISRLTQPQAPSFMNRPKPVPALDKRPSTTARAPPPAPVRKGTPAAAAKAQELQARLDALKKTAEQLRAKSAKPPVGGISGIKRPGERSAPSSPKGLTKTEVKKSEDVEVSSLKLEENVEDSSLLSMKEKEEREKQEEAEKKENERARKAQEDLVKERKDSLLVRAAAALERKLAEEKRVEKEKLEKKQREDEEEEIQKKLEEERRQRERVREEEEEARKKREQLEQEEIERKRAQEEREEQEREEERREAERRREIEEQERERIVREKEKEEEEKRRLEQERLLQETEEAEREIIKQRLLQEEEERKRVKEEEERKRLALEEERRKQKEQEELERRKLEDERRKQREKEEEERRLQKAKEEEERRKQIEKEEEERRQRIERETEARRKQQEIEDERRRQELEEERRKQKEADEKREEERRKQKEKEEEERRKQKEKEEQEEAERKKKQKEKEEMEMQKKQQEAEEKKKKDLEEKKARDSQFLKIGRKNDDEDEEDEDDGRRSSSNLSNITKAKIGGPARKARSGLKFDARASTDVVRAPSVSELSMRMDSVNDTKDEPRDSDLRPERKPFMGAGMNGLAGLAQQAAGGLAALKSLKSSGDRAAPRSPASRKGPFEVTFKSGDKAAVAVLDALESVAKGHAWVILAFDSEVFSLMSTGEGVGQAALDAMKEHLTPTSINFLYFNAGTGDKDEGAAKCSEIMWQGEKTKLLVKARAGAIRETLHLFTKRCFTIGVQKEASTHDDLDMSRIFGNGGEISPAPSSPAPSDNKPSPLLATPRRNSDVPSPLVSRNSVAARSSAMEVPPLMSRSSSVSRSSTNEGKSSPGSSNPLRPDIQWTGQEEIATAVKDFLAAEGPSAFIVLDIEGAKKNEVKVAATGFGALTDEWREKHCGAAKCSVFIIKAENKESGYVSLEKIVYIQWVGRQVKILEKGRAKEIYSGLKEFVREQTGTLAGEMEVLEGEAKDVNLQAVTESITGSRQRGSAMQGTLTKKVERSAGGPVDLSYADEEELRSIIAQLSQEKLTWVALTYSANKAATLEILGSGVGENTSISWGKEPTKAQEEEQNKRDRQADTPTAQYKKFCKQSNIVFIVHRFLRIPEQFQFSKDMGTYAKSHFGLMMWQGEDCRVMDKAASSHHWKDFCNLVRDIMEKAGVYVEAGVYVATKMDELNPRDIRKGMRMDMY